jgi:hypothetical protein
MLSSLHNPLSIFFFAQPSSHLKNAGGGYPDFFLIEKKNLLFIFNKTN